MQRVPRKVSFSTRCFYLSKRRQMQRLWNFMVTQEAFKKKADATLCAVDNIAVLLFLPFKKEADATML